MACTSQPPPQGGDENSDDEPQAQERRDNDGGEPPEIPYPSYDNESGEGRGLTHRTVSDQYDSVTAPKSTIELENTASNGVRGSREHRQGQGISLTVARAGVSPPAFVSTSSTESSSSSADGSNAAHSSKRLRKKQEGKKRRFQNEIEFSSRESSYQDLGPGDDENESQTVSTQSTFNVLPEVIRELTQDPRIQRDVLRTASLYDGVAPITQQYAPIAEMSGSGMDQQTGVENDEERAIRESLQSYYSESGLPMHEDAAPEILRQSHPTQSQSTIQSAFPQPSQATNLAQLNQQLQQAQVSHSQHEGIDYEIDPLPTAVALPVQQEEEEDLYDRNREEGRSESDENVQFLNEPSAALHPIFAAVPATPVPERQTWHSVLRNRRVLALLAVFVTVVLVAITVIAVFVPQSLENQREMNLSLEQKVRLESFTKTLVPVSGRAVLEDPSSAQYRALQWIAFEDGSRVEPSQRTWLIQRFALAVLYFATSEQSTWLEPHNWLAPDHECSWKSVSTIDGEKKGVTACTVLRVTKLRLDANNLIGPFPSEVGWLLDLNELMLHDNKLNGTIASSIGQLTSLQYFYAWNNSLSGELPHEIGQMGQMKVISLSRNDLKGPIPSTIGDLGFLEELHLQQNNLNGTLPTTLGRLIQLEKANLASNQFTGGVPSELGFLKQLTRLTLHTQQRQESLVGLSGAIPPELGLCDSLNTLWLDRNSLTGSLPPQLGLLTDMSNLTMSRNLLTGQVPVEFANLQKLERFWIHGNLMSGDVSFMCNENDALLAQLRLDCTRVNCTCEQCLCTDIR